MEVQWKQEETMTFAVKSALSQKTTKHERIFFVFLFFLHPENHQAVEKQNLNAPVGPMQTQRSDNRN
jgi:hypothetical protein